jgi:hypothetical protein
MTHQQNAALKSALHATLGNRRHMDDFFTLHGEWERKAVRELYSEYEHILDERRLNVRPAAIDIFESQTHWGQWDSEARTIHLSRSLLRGHPWFQILAILKHEMAHQLVDELQNQPVLNGKPHGEAFQWACKRLGVPAEFSKASANLQECGLDWRTDKRDEVSEKMLDRVRKLLALAQSANEHEAVLAMNRVREIYAKYNLEHKEGPEFVHLVISNGSKRMEAHEKKINGILVGHFFVEIISGQTYDVRSGDYHRTVEMIGRRENVMMAEYVYHFLLQQSESLVGQMILNGQRLSRVAKKSFRLGILQGFSEKLKTIEKPAGNDGLDINVISKALVAFNNDPQLNDYISTVYPRLRMVSANSQRIDSAAYAAGKQAGNKITLNKPVAGGTGNLGRMLPGK